MSGHHQLFMPAEAAKFEGSSAFSKLWVREERASFGPQALIKLIRTTLLALKLQNHGRYIENEWSINDLSKRNKRFT